MSCMFKLVYFLRFKGMKFIIRTDIFLLKIFMLRLSDQQYGITLPVYTFTCFH